ncbi:MAG: serine/threonine-protein kinase [Thermomicrobium sp.]|nr:serine/threonine-protein kinase [Thermomicrobium sp.]
MELTEGTRLAGRYRILRPLGHGGMSTVFLAGDEHFPHVERHCAIKIMRASEDPTLAELQRAAFEREASLLATLRHPAIPEVYDYFVEDSRCCLVLEFVDGEDLERLLERTGKPVAESLLIEWTLQLLDVLHFLHTQRPHPIVFRDLKPSNIMLRDDGTIVLIDFGIARLFQPAARGTTIGTEGYAPPEQYRGIAEPRGDLYALGATLYHLATGIDPRTQPPFSLPEVPPRSVNPNLSPEFERIILCALAYDPADRFPSAEAMAHAVRALGHRSDPAAPTPRRTRVVPHDHHPTLGERLSIRWSFQTDDEIRGSPARADRLIVFGSYDGRIYALERDSGLLRWRFSTGRGIATTPLYADGSFVVGSDDGAVYCLAVEDGALRWRYRTAGPVRSSPALAGRVVVFGSDDRFLYALDLETGTPLWRRPARGPVRATPLPLGEFVLCAADDGTVALRSAHDGRTLWWLRLDAPVWGKPALVDGCVVVATISGTVANLDLTEGAPRWQQQLPDAFVAAPTLAANSLLLAGNAGTVFAVHPKTGDRLWELRIGERIASTPMPFQNDLLLATGGGRLYRIALTGEIVARSELGPGIVATPLVEATTIYVGMLDGSFLALDATLLKDGNAP